MNCQHSSAPPLGFVIRFIPPPLPLPPHPWWHPHHHHSLSASLGGTLAADRGRPADGGYSAPRTAPQQTRLSSATSRGCGDLRVQGCGASWVKKKKPRKEPWHYLCWRGEQLGGSAVKGTNMSDAGEPGCLSADWMNDLKEHMNLIPCGEQDAPPLCTVPIDGQRGKTMMLYMAPRWAVWTPIT